jgi:hypothetical protein
LKVRTFIDEQCKRFGFKPICKASQIAPSGYCRRAARLRNPALLPTRTQRYASLAPQIGRV